MNRIMENNIKILKESKFFGLYYDMIHRKKRSFLDLKLKILKDKEEGKISMHIYYELMNDVVLAEKENKQ